MGYLKRHLDDIKDAIFVIFLMAIGIFVLITLLHFTGKLYGIPWTT